MRKISKINDNALDKHDTSFQLDVAREEKTHIGEFQTLLLQEDEEQIKELEEGKEEVAELTV